MANGVIYKESVTNTGTEKDFMSSVISAITSRSTEITYTGNLNQYDSSDTSTIPEFTFSIHGKDIFKIKRAAAISSPSNIFNVSIFVGEQAISTNQELMWRGNSVAISDIVSRTIYLSSIVSNDLILLSFVASAEHYGWKHHTIVSIKSNNVIYGDGYFLNTNEVQPANVLFNIYKKPIYGNPLFEFKDFDSLTSGSFVSRFSYLSQPGKIDYVKSAVYTNGVVKVFEITSIYDCTTVTVGSTLSLNDGAYYAVGPHQIVKVS